MDSEQRWFGVGHCTGPDSRRAGRTAARRALRNHDPALLIVFASGITDPAGMLVGIEEACPGTPVIGCSTEQLVTTHADGVHGVVVTALGGPGFRVRTAVGRCGDGAQRAGGAAVARCVADLGQTDGQRVLMMLTDSWVGDQEEILAGAYSVIGASIPMIGGSASSDPARGRPYQLHNRDVLFDAMVGAAISTDGPLGFGVRHGWSKVGEPMIVTRSVKGDVHTLDDRPALTAYLDRYAAPGPAYTDPQTFERFAQSRPIGIRRRYGVEVRSVSSSAGLAAGRLRASGEVPEGGLVWPMEGNVDTAVEAAGAACQDAVAGLGGAPPLGLLAFDCVSRSQMLGPEGTRREVAQMVEQSRCGVITGLYTWGEIVRTRGLNGYHNQTLAVLAVG